MQFMHDFFNIKKLYIEAIAKFFYVLETVGCICTGFFLLFGKDDTGVLEAFSSSDSTAALGLMLIIFGPIAIRLSFEVFMMSILLVKNVMEINNKLNDKKTNIGFASQDSFTEKFAQTASTYAQAVSAANAQMRAQAAQQASQQAAAAQAPQPTAPAPQAPVAPASEAPAADTKVCPSCGNALPAGAKFCNKCGTAL